MLVHKKISYRKKKSHIVCWPTDYTTSTVTTSNLCLTFGGYWLLRKEEEDLFCFFNVFQIQILETQSCCQNIAAAIQEIWPLKLKKKDKQSFVIEHKKKDISMCKRTRS